MSSSVSGSYNAYMLINSGTGVTLNVDSTNLTYSTANDQYDDAWVGSLGSSSVTITNSQIKLSVSSCYYYYGI